jgi:outer membrane protein assembly factor BamB
MAQEIRSPLLPRRAALLAPLALAGCSAIEGWFAGNKKPLPGKRELVTGTPHGLMPNPAAPRVTLPPPVRNAGWPQAGGNPAHLMGHLQANATLAEAWRADIGAGGGYRRVILAQPVVSAGRVFTMDSAGTVTAFQLGNGARLWRAETRRSDDDNPNVGGGLAEANGVLYAVNGLADIVAFDSATGTVKWRRDIHVPARSAPTVVAGRLFCLTIDDRLLALNTTDGRQLWQYQAANATTAMLGQPAPAYANGLVVAGFGSGDLACLRGDTGTVIWTDSLAAATGPASMVNLSSVRGRPVIANGEVLAIGMGGEAVGIDLPSGRRLWERNVAGINSPWVAGGWMFVVSLDQKMAAISTSDGEIAWVTQLPEWRNPQKRKDSISWFGPVLLTDRLVVAGTSRDALSVSPYSGEILSRQALSAAAAPLEPVVADGTLLIVSDDGRLLALR